MDESPTGQEWWQQREGWGTFGSRIEERGAVSLDADVIGKYFDLYRYSCQPSVSFAWDSWARCTIKCDHGEWWRDSHLLNFTEAFVFARREWAAGAQHPTWEESEDE